MEKPCKICQQTRVAFVWVILIIVVTGALVSNFIGRKLVEIWEKILNRIPGFRGIYNALKQLSDDKDETSCEER